MTSDTLPLLTTGLAGALIGVGVAWGTMVANLRALTHEVHALRTSSSKELQDHEERVRALELDTARITLRLASVEAPTVRVR